MSLPKDPFGEIALCLSGGGYRAASFHLGSMAYLNRISYQGSPLLHKVKGISTVSGGTITGALYVLSDSRGNSFDEFYKQLMNFLQQHDLVVESLKKLKINGKWDNDLKSKNLINAFAEIYDEALTGQANYGALTKEHIGHIDFCAFNSTEFTTGINFRLQSEWRGKRQNKMIKRGNSNFTFAFDAQNEVKIADIIAASSCFPGGFEPINFPGDFIHKEAPLLTALKVKDKYKQGIGLMDGGIYDNQGIDSIQLSEKRRGINYFNANSTQSSERLPYDLLIISDVSSPDISNPFRFHQVKERSFGNYSIRKFKVIVTSIIAVIKWIPIILVIGGIILGFLRSWKDTTSTGIGIMLIIIGIMFWLINSFLLGKMKKWVSDGKTIVKDVIGSFYLDKLSILDIKDYRLKDLEPLFVDRLSSLSLMVNSLFLKQIRRLKYASIFEDPLYKNRRIANLIKELSPKDWHKTKDYQELKRVDKFLKGNYNQVIGRKIGDLSNEASSFGTTLWFSEEDKLKEILDKLVALGQMTMCFNLLIHITYLKNHTDFNTYSDPIKRQINKVFKQCKEDWIHFKSKPQFLVHD